MNPYLNPERLEFVITNACSSKCKHCSWGECPDTGISIDADIAVAAIKRLTKRFKIKSVMTFGGEPLLFADTVIKIHAAAQECNIPDRSIITNGFFSKDDDKINEVAKALCNYGVDIWLSADAFHQEFIPLGPVLQFADALLRHGVHRLQAHPAWVVNKSHDNPYNIETKRILKAFSNKGIPITKGNDIIPAGNALKHLAEYYLPPGKVDLSAPCGSEPYTTRPDEINRLSINPDGGVKACSEIGNIYHDDILDIINRYNPYSIPALRAVLDSGVTGLLRYAQSKGINVDIGDCHSACKVCRKVRAQLTPPPSGSSLS